MKFQVGDTVWVVPGRTPPSLIVVQCKILHVKHTPPDIIPYYFVDEPIESGLPEYDVYATKEEAIERLKQILLVVDIISISTLSLFRESAIKFMYICRSEDDLSLPEYPDKDRTMWIGSQIYRRPIDIFFPDTGERIPVT